MGTGIVNNNLNSLGKLTITDLKKINGIGTARAVTIAAALDEEEKAYAYLTALHGRIDSIIDKLRIAKAKPKRVMLMEWMEPIYNCGHWIPDQIAMSGGIEMLSNPKGDSIVTSWDKIVRYNPEVLIIAPCGFHVERSLEEIHVLSQRKEWAMLTAVQNGAVFIVDFDLFTQPSASTLVDGIEALSALFHPEIFSLKDHLHKKVSSVEKQHSAFAGALYGTFTISMALMVFEF